VFWFAIYASAGIAVAVIASAVARHHRQADKRNPGQWVPATFLAGVLWPIILIGFAQLLILLVMAKAPAILGSIGGFART